jgi:hypothetical protein
MLIAIVVVYISKQVTLCQEDVSIIGFALLTPHRAHWFYFGSHQPRDPAGQIFYGVTVKRAIFNRQSAA